MRERMERLVVLPFSVGCISDSSVSVLSPLSKPHQHRSLHQEIRRDQEEEDQMKNVFKFLTGSKPEISTSINRLFKSFKTISQLFGDKEEENEEIETTEMEIGVPTDVKHVSHVGWDSGLTAVNVTDPPCKRWEEENLIIPPELFAAASSKQDVINLKHHQLHQTS